MRYAGPLRRRPLARISPRHRPPGPLPFGSPTPIPLRRRSLLILLYAWGAGICPLPPAAHLEPRAPLPAGDGHHIGGVPPGREPPLLNAQEPVPLSLPERVLDSLAADPCQGRDVLQHQGAAAM